MKNEIILYQVEDLTTRIEVQIENDTVWLNRQQISSLFDRDVKTIGKHINNIFKESELEKKSTVAKFATVQCEMVSVLFCTNHSIYRCLKIMNMKNEIILYQTKEFIERIEVRVEDETVWLSKIQMSSLFGRDRTVISRHISNIFKEGELEKNTVCSFFTLTTKHGAIKGKTQTKNVEFYNLDVIISVGYRVKSKQGTQFRIWANKILKDYLLKGYSLNNRMNRIEDNMFSIIKKVNEIDLQINTNLPPTQGVFFDNQVFDAYTLIADIVRTAKKSIILIDNYIDDTVLTHLCKKGKNVNVTLLTKTISKQLQLDVKKANTQYPTVAIKQFTKAHDRFLIIDQNEIYHIGASLKDLGKKWFAFTKLDVNSVTILKTIHSLIKN